MTALVLALDELMRHPGYAEFAEQARRLAPVDLRDQDDAATTAAHRVLTAGAQRLGVTPRQLEHDRMPDWLRLGALDAFVGYVSGKARTCRHSPVADRPSPVMTAAWRPGLVVCPPCTYLLSLQNSPTADLTCDACGHVCAGLDKGEGIYPGMVQIGPMVYQYGACEGCRPPVAVPAQGQDPAGRAKRR